MKKLLLPLLIALSALTGYSSPLSPEQALLRASSSSEVKKVKGLQATDLKLIKTGYTSGDQAAYYVFTSPWTSVFLSADDVARPILGYTDSGNFDSDNIPPALQWWLDEYARELEWALSDSGKVQNETTIERHEVKSANSETREPVSPLLSTTWDQSIPFNRFCPIYNGFRTVTGCIATSMAQVMKYFEWPQEPVKPISYTWNKEVLTSPEVTLDWDNMLDSYNGNYTDEQSIAVARLMQVAGYSVSMIYDTASNGGSAAFSDDIRSALVNNFGYDVGIDFLHRNYYTTQEWTQIMYENLLNIGPIIYNGSSERSAHSFVCDGFDGTEYFHINWGWSGVSDGYFLLSALNPHDVGTGGGTGGYNYKQGAVVGIRRPQPNSIAPIPFLACSTEISGSASGRKLTIGATDNGGYWNYGSVSGLFYLGVSLENQSTGSIYNLDSSSLQLGPNYGTRSYVKNIPNLIPDGTYTVRPIYHLESEDWEYVRFPVLLTGITRDSFDISISSSGITILEEEKKTLAIVSWDSETGLSSGKEFNGFLEVINTSASSQELSLSASLRKLSDSQYVTVQELGNSTISVPANSTAKMEFEGKLDNITSGKYYLEFRRGSRLFGRVEVMVSDEGDFKIISYRTCDFSTGEKYNFVVTVESSYHGSREYVFDAFICKEGEEPYTIVESLGSSKAMIDGKSTGELSFSGTLGDIEPGRYLLAIAEADRFVGVKTIEIYAEGFNCKSFSIDPERIVPGRESTVEIILSNSYDSAVPLEFSLSLCSIVDHQYSPLIPYGRLNDEVVPGRELNLQYTTFIPEEIEDGNYYLVLSIEKEDRIIIAEEVTVDSNYDSGIRFIESDSFESSYRYFNLQGIEVPKRNLKPGLYIRFDGIGSTKVVIK